MKIGIISINIYSKSLNFACPLHTYAFQQFLLKNGIESTVISYKPMGYGEFDAKHPYDYYRKKYLELEKKPVYSQEEQAEKEKKLKDLQELCDNLKPLYREREIRYEKFQNFIDTRYMKTRECYDSDLLEVMDPGFDCYICATDVIWKIEPGFGFDRSFFLASSSMENKWKISYAASRNVKKAKTEEDKKQFFKYIDDIDRISVREASLKEDIEKNTGRKAELVLDPVLLHEKEFYEEFLVKPAEENYLLLYYVMEKAKDTLEQAVKYARKHGLKIVELTERSEDGGRLRECSDVEIIYRYDIGIEEWLGYIQYADCIFTNSFHACCFCALFEKKFFAGKRGGDKVGNILNMLGLSDRRIDGKSDLTGQEPPEIDYDKVRKNLAQWREKSGAFILNAIHDLEGKQPVHKDYDAYRKTLTYKIFYGSGKAGENITWGYDGKTGVVKKVSSGKFEFQPYESAGKNDGTTKLQKNEFYVTGYRFAGWRLKIKIDYRWFWYLSDGSMVPTDCDMKKNARIQVFQEEDPVPYIPVNRISIILAEGIWEKMPGTKPEILSKVWNKMRKIFS